jgi:hypothetical protein
MANRNDINKEQSGFQDSWMRGEEDSAERIEVNPAAGDPVSGPKRQTGVRDEEKHHSIHEEPCDDDDRYRHQQRGEKNPGDSKPKY